MYTRTEIARLDGYVLEPSRKRRWGGLSRGGQAPRADELRKNKINLLSLGSLGERREQTAEEGEGQNITSVWELHVLALHQT